MKISPTTTVASSSGTNEPTPTKGSEPTPTQGSEPTPTEVFVPKGQLERTRAKLPNGWSNDGGHNGFKSASIEQVADGYYLYATNASDVPKGRQ
jgi:hypothetical protein